MQMEIANTLLYLALILVILSAYKNDRKVRVLEGEMRGLRRRFYYLSQATNKMDVELMGCKVTPAVFMQMVELKDKKDRAGAMRVLSEATGLSAGECKKIIEEL
ncbi:hypothetical protein [Ligilactobacillus ceti]|uniref:Ribosomal protein L7/L12 C-terminal domain-containing protein n=1 Tax=Ligilactobacillus ceti DSM 22408 TaxID=1122146 RepID=A0A0R2KSL7_9LACO|nr:hypothetical protein [Ligilactobacillus ceti]KRN89303.1 hypothetical protein IV53_GL000020 [Ligilactobacillus ceti DSM 22408]